MSQAVRWWRVVGNFHRVGEVVVLVTSPNWQGGLRKGALALKRHDMLKGRRISVGSFTIQEIEPPTPPTPRPQEAQPVLPMAQPIGQSVTVPETVPETATEATQSEGEEVQTPPPISDPSQG